MKIILILLLLLPVSVFAERVEIIRVVDGDTVVVDLDNQEEKVRIIGINTPESVDPRRAVECFGKEASEYAASLLELDSLITLENYSERDRHGRILAYIELKDGSDFGAEMISSGYAYAYRSYDHERMGTYVRLESEARSAERGLWAPDACLDNKQSQEIIEYERREFFTSLFRIIESIFTFFFR